MIKTQKLILILFIAICNTAFAKSVSYVDESKSFLEIGDPNREAEAWAMCVAIYEISAAMLIDSNPAQARQMQDLGNGAKAAVMMSQVVNELPENVTTEQFSAIWKMAQKSMEGLPETRRNYLLAQAEALQDKKQFLSNVALTLNVCMKNLKSQQMYIDIWRDFMKSGAMKLD